MKGIVYCAYNTVNGKRYIGKTIKSLNQRINLHYYSSNCTAFHRALMKYPKEVWEWSVIDTGEEGLELAQKEQYWIAYYDTYNNPSKGYNLTRGGEGSVGVIASEAHRRKTRDTMLELKINHYKPKTEAISKPLKCIETNEIFNSISEAARNKKIPNSNISNAAHKGGVAGGFHWEFLTGLERLKTLKNALYCVELDKFYESFKEARREDRFHEGNLRLSMVNGDPYEPKKYAGYTFYWVNPELHVELTNNSTTK